MGRNKKVNPELGSVRESISDIFDDIKKEEIIEECKDILKKKSKTPKIQKTKILKDYLKDLDGCEVKDVNSSDEFNDTSSEAISLCEENQEKIEDSTKIVKEKLAVIDKFYKKYPHLKKDKNDFVNEILNNKPKKGKSQKLMITDDYVVEKLVFNNITYYKDEDNNLISDKMKLLGFVEKNGEYYECYFF